MWRPLPVNSVCTNPSSTHGAQQQQTTSSERESEIAVEIARLKRQLAEQAEELAILQKAATYFANRLK